MPNYLSRVVIERIPTGRQRAAMPNATIDERVESQTPVSCWLDIAKAYELLLWLKQNRPILVDHDGTTLIVYALQQSEWAEGSEVPAPSPFDVDAVAQFPKFDGKAECEKMLAASAENKARRKNEKTCRRP